MYTNICICNVTASTINVTLSVSQIPCNQSYNNSAQLTWTVCEVDKWLDF